MMIVIIIMGILLSIAIPIYSQSIVRARESVLRNDLAELNNWFNSTRSISKRRRNRWMIWCLRATFTRFPRTR